MKITVLLALLFISLYGRANSARPRISIIVDQTRSAPYEHWFAHAQKHFNSQNDII